ncbi:methyltransferase type 12 [Saccharothrix yanglingensis]|uniref:Methyltransferase type 12 n=1 Tax=Saccharothrix yanglingensis TaxID=659496 RepID=A0ABU0XA14_9PSEU|nr:methyltransferase type 12 [Saccharothrix yanglingensis]
MTPPRTAAEGKGNRVLIAGSLPAAAHALGCAAVEDVDVAPELVRELDLAVLLGICDFVGRAAARVALPADPADVVPAADRHRWIAGHWVRALAAEGWADVDGSGLLRSVRSPRRAELAAAREAITVSVAGLGYPPALATYVLDSLRALPSLLTDEVTAQALLFRDSERATADAAYRDNPVNRYLNAAAASVVADLVRARGGLRVLELGAGTGATTADLLPALAGTGSDYLFTDLSPLFLRDAAARFADHPYLRFRLVDFTEPLEPQVREGDFDLVVAVNTAHNATDVPDLLRQVTGLLRADGALLLVETCHEHHQSLASMPFLLSPRPGGRPVVRTDLRAGTTRTYLTGPEWASAAKGAGLEQVVDLPPPDHPLAAFSQRLAVFTPSSKRSRTP